MSVRAYEIGVVGTDWKRTVYALSSGKAKYSYLLDLQDCWPNVSFKDLTCKALGSVTKPIPSTSDFQKTADYRGVPFARIGMKVEVEGHAGVIVGKNSSANFQVLFTDGKFKGEELNCHPNWMFKYFDEQGRLIKEFGA